MLNGLTIRLEYKEEGTLLQANHIITKRALSELYSDNRDEMMIGLIAAELYRDILRELNENRPN